MNHKTSDYTIFKKFIGNRPIDPLNLKKIINSIRLNNMLELRPILVNKDMEVIDGQHRLEAAMTLGIPVYYTIQEEESPADMILLNSCQKQWTIENYVHFYASQGSPNYMDVVNLCKRMSITINEFLTLTGGDGGKNYKGLKEGKLKIKLEEVEEDVKEKINFIGQITQLVEEKTIGPKLYLHSKGFKKALSFLLNHQGFSKDIFLSKVKINMSKIFPCTTTAQYVSMFKSIYNFRNSDPI